MTTRDSHTGSHRQHRPSDQVSANTFEYYRHGTLSLYAAFNTKTGEVLGKTAARHTSAEFVAFPTDIVVNQPVRIEFAAARDDDNYCAPDEGRSLGPKSLRDRERDEPKLLSAGLGPQPARMPG